MIAHQFKIGDRVEVVAPDPEQGWDFIKGRGTGRIVAIYPRSIIGVVMEDPTMMLQPHEEEGWAISASCLRPLSPPEPDRLTATALELAEACCAWVAPPMSPDE